MRREMRQRKILALLEEESGLSAGELSRRLRVSRMTVHRDLQSLNRQGLLLRIRGGAVLKAVPRSPATGFCPACDRVFLPHQRSEFKMSDGSLVRSCCAACGLLQFLHTPAATGLMVADQISGKLLPASAAYYLANSLATPCCQPSLLSFASETEVTLFQAGFGGSVAHLEEALEFLRVAEGLSGA